MIKSLSLFVISTAVVFIILVALAANATASEYERPQTFTFTSPTTYVTEKATTGLALSMGASAIDCASTTRKWQIGGGIGYYGSQSAPVIGACKKYSGALFKASIGREDGVTGGNFGVMFLLE